MIITKAIAAILMTSAGGFAAGTAAYFQAHPRATQQPTRDVPSQSKPIEPPTHQAAAQPVSEPRVVVIDPVFVISPDPLRGRRTTKANAFQGPCSEWQELATGPEGRRVRVCVR